MSPKIDLLVEKVVKVNETRCPFKIAKSKNIIILHENLGDIFGYYNKIFRIQMIHLNKNLNERELMFTCAHELGHALLHSSANTPALSKKSLVSEYKIEKEANYFATKLLIDNSHEELNMYSKYDILDYYGLPYQMEQFI